MLATICCLLSTEPKSIEDFLPQLANNKPEVSQEKADADAAAYISYLEARTKKRNQKGI